MSRKGEESTANRISLDKGDGKTAMTSSSSAQVLSIPVAVLSRDEEMGLTVYGGESGVRPSGARNKEMEMMIEENETRKERSPERRCKQHSRGGRVEGEEDTYNQADASNG